MIEPPSKQLLQVLSELELCRPRDLRRCRPRVRQLAHDLPAFDSVWIDALVQARRITPFQAAILESETPEALRVGPCNLVDRLGYGSDTRNTFLAVHRRSRRRCVLKMISTPVEEAAEQQARLQSIIQAASSLRYPGVVIPHACLSHAGRLVVISRFVQGFDLRELVIRRGRFQPGIVRELGRQLIAALTELERVQISHGDLHLSKVRMTASGRAVLVDTAVDAATRPRASFPHSVNAQDCDGVAPELIGTGRAADRLSDMYSLGCLLWQLLAGRPPFPTGDPLAKLACHQTQTVADIREWAPDTPARLADSISLMTSLDREARPQSFRELQEQWGAPRRGGRAVLRRFHASFRQAVRVSALNDAQPARFPKAWMTAALLLAATAAFALSHEGARSHLLAITSDLLETSRTGAETRAATDSVDSLQTTPVSASEAVVANSVLRPLPAADEGGRVLLESGRRYRAGSLTAQTPLEITAASIDEPAEIVVEDAPLQLIAPNITLQNIRFVHAEASPPPTPEHLAETAAPTSTIPVRSDAPALLLCECEQLTIRGCAFHTHPAVTPEDAPQPKPVGLAWKPSHTHTGETIQPSLDTDTVSDSMPRTTSLAIHDTTFIGNSTAAYLRAAPEELTLVNTLKVGAGALCNLPLEAETAECRCQLQGITLREAHSLMRLRMTEASSRVLQIASTRSVLAVRPSGALFELLADTAPTAVAQLVEVTGDASLAPVDVTATRWLQDSIPGAVWTGNISIEGISVAPFTFAGPDLHQAADSELLEFQRPPRITPDRSETGDPDTIDDQRPGIDVSRLQH